MNKSRVKVFMESMQDVLQFASYVKAEVKGLRTFVSYSLITSQSRFLDEIICRLADNGYRFEEYRRTIHELTDAFQASNEFSIWQITDFHQRDYGGLPLELFRKNAGLDLAKHKRVFGGTLASFSISPDLPVNEILDSIYRAINFSDVVFYNGRRIKVGDIIQLKGRYYYVDRFGYKPINIF
jgi:hypothetical protein